MGDSKYILLLKLSGSKRTGNTAFYRASFFFDKFWRRFRHLTLEIFNDNTIKKKKASVANNPLIKKLQIKPVFTKDSQELEKLLPKCLEDYQIERYFFGSAIPKKALGKNPICAMISCGSAWKIRDFGRLEW